MIDFTNAIKIDSSNAEAYLERSKVKRQLNDITGSDKDLLLGRKLLDNLDKGLAAYDDGNTAFEVGDYSTAINHYNKAILLIPTTTSIYYRRGYAKYCLEDYKSAMQDFDKNIELNAANKDLSYYQRGKIKSHFINDKNGALEDFNMAIEINSNDADYYYSRAILLNAYEALQDLNKAIQINPNEPDFYIARSLKKSALQDFKGSILDMTKYIQLNPQDGLITTSEALCKRAGIKTLLEDLDGALEDYDRAIEIDNTNEKFYVDRGVLKECLQDFAGAILDYNEAIELAPKYAEAFYRRGSLKQNIGLDDDGIMDVIRAKAFGYEE